MKKPIKQMLIIMLAIICLALIVVGCNGASNPFSQLTQDEIEITVEVGEPIQVKQPFAVTITVVTKEDISDLQVSLSKGEPAIQIVDGFSEYWVVDSVAQQPMVFTTAIKLIREGRFNIRAFAQDPSIARVVDGSVSLHITNKGAVINPTPDKNKSAVTIISGTQIITSTPVPTPNFSPIAHNELSLINLNLSIPDDGQWVSLPLSVTEIISDAVVSGVSIKFLIDHPQGEELTVQLVAPDNAKTAQLWERQTVGPDNLYEGLFYFNQFDILLFNGVPMAGQWQLQVRDEIAGNVGTIESAVLIVGYRPPITNPVQSIEKPEPHTPPPFPENVPTFEGSQSIPNSLLNAL